MNLKERLEVVRSKIDKAASKAGKPAKDVVIVAVTKGVASEKISEAREAGIEIFGENKVQEAEPKILNMQPPPSWHMIGHLQSNKVKTAVALFQMIQSVDSVRLAKAISVESQAACKTLPVLLEVNISGEARKFGFKPEEVYAALEEIVKLPGLKVMGLMGLGPLDAVEDETRRSFGKLRNIFSVCKTLKRENLEMKHLSMGMSDDFEIAVEEGSNMVRIGQALFGARG